MVVEFTTTCAIVAYHHLSCEFEPHVVSFSGHCLMTLYVYNSSHNCVGNNIVVVLLVLLVKICHIMTQRCFMLCTTSCAIVAYHHLSCEFEPHSWRGVFDTTACDKVCQWLAAGRWFSLGTLVSFTNTTDCHYIPEILLHNTCYCLIELLTEAGLTVL
jgi:hypothetical protein